MYVSFVGNRKPKIKWAAVVLIVVLCVMGINNIICYVTGYSSTFALVKDFTYKNVGSMTVAFYKYILDNEYSVANYKEASNIPMSSDIIDVINRHNNLYAYMEDEAKEIALTYYDPSYVKKDFESIQVATRDEEESVAKPQEQETAATVTPDKSDMGYVIPAVAKEGIIYDINKLSDFKYLLSSLYIVPSRAKVIESELVAAEMIEKDMTLKGDNSKPQILIYHTHSQEGFADSVPGDESTTIVGVGAYLAKIFSEVYGYNVIHCTEKFDMKNGSLDRSKAYTYAGETIAQILADNPSIEVILDIHRDGIPESAGKLVTNINGKDTAKIMFFNGVSRSSATGDIDYLYNRYKKDNLAFSFQLKLKAMECYPEFTRKNYIDAYQYNLHYRPKSVLVEVGAQNNTLKEELNAMEVLAEVVHRVIK